MGVVYRARDENLERDVALKVIASHILGDDRARRRFRKEALALSRLNHPNIEMVHEFDSIPGVDFIVMELVPGETLSDRIARDELPETEIVAIGEQIADGLAAAHEHGIIHRDIKPSNICLTPEGKVKILDFGLAMQAPLSAASGVTVSETVSDPGAIVGTLPYMAPEQLRGEPLDTRSDVYAFGAVLFELATGRRPFVEAQPAKLLDAILNQVPPDIRTLRPKLSTGLGLVVAKALEKDPAKRYASTRELGTALRRVAQGKGGSWLPDWRDSAYRRVLGQTAMALVGIAVLAVLLLSARDLWNRFFGPVAPQTGASLAVLPLVNLAAKAGEDYFADGMTEELTTRLAQIQSLEVISSTSAMRYKGTKKTLRQIARELHVHSLVEGTIQRVGGDVRITAKLTDPATERSVWADSYERSLTNVFSLQNEIARTIADRIRIRLTPAERTQLARSDPVNPAAHAEYLKGRYYFALTTPDAFAEAIRHFQKSLELDPGYAPAYSALAEAYRDISSQSIPPSEAMPRARENAQKALLIDSTLAEPRMTLGYIEAFYDWHWNQAEPNFRDAIRLYPSSAEAHRNFGMYLTVMGRFSEASKEIERARCLDPLEGYISLMRLFPIYNSRRYDDAITASEALLRSDPSQVLANHIIGQAYLMKHDYSRAIAAYERITDLDSLNSIVKCWRARMGFIATRPSVQEAHCGRGISRLGPAESPPCFLYLRAHERQPEGPGASGELCVAQHRSPLELCPGAQGPGRLARFLDILLHQLHARPARSCLPRDEIRARALSRDRRAQRQVHE